MPKLDDFDIGDMIMIDPDGVDDWEDNDYYKLRGFASAILKVTRIDREDLMIKCKHKNSSFWFMPGELRIIKKVPKPIDI